jgi:DNA-binding MarR family transcriptional regulator
MSTNVFPDKCVDTRNGQAYLGGVGRALLERLKQGRPFSGPVEESLINLLLASAWLEERIGEALEPVSISHAQYNVMRILRGAHPDGHPRCEIAARLIVRAPDVTRLVDRLVRRGLVTRGRGQHVDRRQSVARLTAKGLALLKRADQSLVAVRNEVEGRMGARRSAELSRLCEALWSGTDS